MFTADGVVEGGCEFREPVEEGEPGGLDVAVQAPRRTSGTMRFFGGSRLEPQAS
ncbi:hypothetical protein [Streptomyces sp. NRRL F-2664]|uniref:hypothetical protein n=1 Tax=Streptomyces sp. NRRL F-2664 TaxID=1463842 RepID=UPI000A896F6A|nr:hypothetical protein [Streptomyces sp. NRRL F-2664]